MVDQTVTIKALLQDLGLTKGLTAIKTGFTGIQSRVDELGTRLGPLTSKVAGFVAAFAGLAAAKSAVQSARQQAEAEADLLSALRGRRSELEKINKVAEQIQRNSRIGDEVLVKQAAILVRIGVAAGRVPEALQVAVDTAAALNIPLESAVRAVGLIESGIKAPGAIGRLIPELKELEESGRLAAEGLQVLKDKFGGAEAEQAATVFGTITKTLNEIDDQGESAGLVLAQVEKGFTEGLLIAAKQLSAFITSDEGQAIVKLVAEALKLITSLIPQIAAVGAAVAAVNFGIWLAPVLVLSTEIAAIAGAIGFILFQLGDWLGLNDKISRKTGEIVGGVRQVLRDLANGTLTIEDLFVAVSAGFEATGKQVSLFFTSVKKIFVATFDTIVGLFGVVSLSLVRAGLSIANEIQKGFIAVIKAVASAIDAITNKTADALETIPGVGKEVADKIRTNLEGAVPPDFFDLSVALQATDEGLEAAKKQLLQAFPDALEEIKNDMVVTQNEITKIQDDAADDIAERHKKSKEKLAEISQVAREKEAKLEEAAIQEQIRLERQLNDQKLLISKEFADAASDLELKLLEQSFKNQEITFAEFAAKRRELQLDPLKEELALTSQTIKLVEDKIAAMRAEGVAAESINEQLRILIQLRQQEQGILIGIRTTSLQIDEDLKTKNEAIIDQAQDLVDKIKEARDNLAESQKETAGLVQSGFLFKAEAVDRNRKAIELYNMKVDELNKKLAVLRFQNPQVADSIDEVTNSITDLNDEFSRDKQQDITDFFRGLEAGLNNSIDKLDDLRTAGLRIGEDISKSLSQAFKDFIKGEGDFKSILSGLLDRTSDIFLELAFANLAKLIFDPDKTTEAVAKATTTAAGAQTEDGGFFSNIFSGIGSFLGFGEDARASTDTINITAQVVNVNGGASTTGAVSGALEGATEEGGLLSSLGDLFSSITSGGSSLLSGGFDKVVEFFKTIFGGGGEEGVIPDTSTGTSALSLLSSFGLGSGSTSPGTGAGGLTSLLSLFGGGGGTGGVGGLASLFSLFGGGGAATGGTGLFAGLFGGGAATAGAAGATTALSGAAAPFTGGLTLLIPFLLPLFGKLFGGGGKGGGLSLFSSLFGLFGGGGAGFGGFFAEGGQVDGPAGVDKVGIMATRNEYVHPVDAVSYYGLGIMEAIKNRLIPREMLEGFGIAGVSPNLSGHFAGGGSVGRSSSDGYTQAVTIPSEQSMERQLSAGRRTFLDFVESEAPTINIRLGRKDS